MSPHPAGPVRSILWVRLPGTQIYPVSLIYLTDHVHKHRPEVEQRVVDLAMVDPSEEQDRLLEEVARFNPDAIGFSWRNVQPFSPKEDDESLVNAFSFYFSPSLLAKARASLNGVRMVLSYESRVRRNLGLVNLVGREFPNKRIWMGGPAVSVFADLMAGKCPEETVLVQGEGEDVVLKLIDGRDVMDERVVIRRNNRLIFGQKSRFVKLEEDAPVDFDFIDSTFPDFRRYLDGFVGVPTKRGCPYKCGFCLYNYIDGYAVRYRRPEVVAEEIRALNRRYGVSKIWFADSQFYPSKTSEPVVARTLDEIIEDGPKIEWSTYLRIDNINESLAEKMVASGLSQLELGIVSGAQRVVDHLKLGYKWPKLLDACRLMRQAGYDGPVKLDLSFNAPGETKGTILETIETVGKIQDIFGPERVRPFIFFLAVQPHTPLAEIAIKKGYLKSGFNPLALNPFVIRNLVYNPPPLGRTIGRAVIESMGGGGDVGREVLRRLKAEFDPPGSPPAPVRRRSVPSEDG